ncbi:acetylcholine receptor subunit alpha-like isoform X2 [Anastrepha obliqua]|uniref:acetylcholine receptor subunit alpha-like isoform X2 n=1 Tax=Anastrepha obliqua TaxID=95512 RepID=UPI00240A24DE|nr:acetylcholine receptor subunit alpha-like isoform X2 [Anastrepha obliqua]
MTVPAMRSRSEQRVKAWFLSALMVHSAVAGNPDAKRLYDDLLSNYNKLVRPVVNTTDVLKVCIKLKLSQLIDVNLKNQIMTTNLWVEQSWYDYKLRWEPKEYGGVHMLHVPSDHIWRPDIVLYNNADGHYEVTLMTKAKVHSNGLVIWQPPVVYKSSCSIDVEYFPYDVQTCILKLGSWTYDGFKVDLRHMDEQQGNNIVDVGVDLSEFYMSVEWDILEVPAVRNEKFYTCCDEPYLDITFNITMRRKTLFYTVNIIIPCMGISFLTVLTFYLPSDSGEKVTLSISILISLHVFFLLVVEIIPPTSLVVPLLGKYLIFAMILVSISICVTVVVLNVHFRSPQTHRMAPWVKCVFVDLLPQFLFIKRPKYNFETSSGSGPFGGSCQIHGSVPPLTQHAAEDSETVPVFSDVTSEIKVQIHRNPGFLHAKCPAKVHRSCFCVRFIAEHTKLLEDSTKVKEDWKYVAMVLDRLFLWIFTLAVLAGTAGIILQAPTLYDDRIPIIENNEIDFSGISAGRCRPSQ